MSRGHVQGYDSNAGQFERMGNPWLTRREQQELGNFPVSKGQQRRNRKPKPCSLPYAEVKRIARALTPAEEKARAQRAMLNHVLRLGKERRGQEVREVAGYEPRVHSIRAEARPMHSTDYARRGWQKMNAAAVRLAAEHAFAVSEAGRLEEKRRLERQIAALQSRVASLG